MYKYRYCLSIALGVVVSLLICGCTYYTKWDWKEGEVFRNGRGNCLSRATELAEIFQNSGKDCMVIYGRYRGKPHAWVEMDEKIYDPAQYVTCPEFYTGRYKAIVYLHI